MTADDKFGLRPVWDAELELYEVFRRACADNGLSFFAAAGTALGAIRHGGFIPWDDDFDLLMMRPDYERWKSIANKVLPEGFKWVCAEDDPEYDLTFGKVCDMREERLEHLREKTGLELGQGIFIDVYPIDRLPSTRFFLTLWLIKRALYRRLLSRRPGLPGLFFQALRPLFGFGADEYRNRLRFMRRLANRDFAGAKMCGHANDSSNYRRNHWWRVEWFRETKWVPFEDTAIPMPIDYDAFLRGTYGDYMKLPPEDKRVPTHQLPR